MPLCSLVGRAAHAIQEYKQAELAYRKALEVEPDSLPAWTGLARLYATTVNSTGAVEANEKVVGYGGPCWAARAVVASPALCILPAHRSQRGPVQPGSPANDAVVCTSQVSQ